MPEQLLSGMPHYGIVMDLLIIIAVTGLWLAWWRNQNRLKKTEQLLADSIQQLVLASTQLKQAMDHIQEYEKEQRTKEEVRTSKAPHRQAAPDAVQDSDTTLMRTLLLQRKGKSDEAIAESLGIPIDQVRLMLKIHAARDD